MQWCQCTPSIQHVHVTHINTLTDHCLTYHITCYHGHQLLRKGSIHKWTVLPSIPSAKAGSLALAVRWAKAAWGSSWKLSFSSASSWRSCLLFRVASSSTLLLRSADRVEPTRAGGCHNRVHIHNFSPLPRPCRYFLGLKMLLASSAPATNRKRKKKLLSTCFLLAHIISGS